MFTNLSSIKSIVFSIEKTRPFKKRLNDSFYKMRDQILNFQKCKIEPSHLSHKNRGLDLALTKKKFIGWMSVWSQNGLLHRVINYLEGNWTPTCRDHRRGRKFMGTGNIINFCLKWGGNGSRQLALDKSHSMVRKVNILQFWIKQHCERSWDKSETWSY